ncbi:MAG: VOC family protein [Candidatus Cloacimonetes bacterium]|nr:VOC family protein [Candidatus Cloacimonadota bacterium]
MKPSPNAAAEFYVSVFDNYNINFINLILATPSGDAEVIGLQIMGFEFIAKCASQGSTIKVIEFPIMPNKVDTFDAKNMPI